MGVRIKGLITYDKLIFLIIFLVLLITLATALTFKDDTDSNWNLGTMNNMEVEGTGTGANLTSNRTTGGFLSQIFNAGSSVDWKNITYNLEYPYNEELPSNQQDVNWMNMTGNVLLMHFNNDSSVGENDTHVYDWSGSGNNGTGQGGVKVNTTDCKFGNCFTFDGVDDYVLAKDGKLIASSINSSVSVWIKTTAAGITGGRTLYCERAASGNDVWKLDSLDSDRSANGIQMTHRDDAGTLTFIYATNEIVINDGVLHNAVIIKSGASIVLYVDGKVDTSGTLSGNDTFTNAGIEARIGGDKASTIAYTDGTIDEVAIWNRSLSADEIKNLYNRGAVKFNVSVRSCDDNLCSGEVFNITTNNASFGRTELLTDQDNQYFQYMFNYTNSSSATVRVNDLTLGYDIINKGGLISTTEGATPFYTNASANPLTTSSLSAGQSELITFWVNATATPGNTYEFYAFANTTSDLSISAITLTYNITINDSSSPTISNFKFIALDSDKAQIGTDEMAFNFSNLETIEYMNISFEVTDASGLSDDIAIYFTANGTSACSLGNNQSSKCYNYTDNEWIEFRNQTNTPTFMNWGASGDYIDCDYSEITNGRNYTCQIDEHYNPNVWKHYPLNFTNMSWQSGTNQRIKKNTVWKIELDTMNIPLDADYYKLDFRVNATIGLTPTQSLLAYMCNSTYSTGDPSISPTCQLVAGKLPANLQDDSTKFRAIFTKNLTQTLGDIKYVLLESDSPPSKYYSMKTYGFLGSDAVRTSISINNGDSYTTLADGYETELNINWFYDSTNSNTTQILFKIYSNDAQNNNANSSIQVLTWDYGALNEPPIVDIIVPTISSNHSGTIEINWTTAEPNGQSYLTNITLVNSTDTVAIAGNLDKTFSNYSWDSSDYDGLFNLTVLSRENSTADEFQGNDTHQILIDNTLPAISISYPNNNTYFSKNTVDINYTIIETNLDSCWWTNNSGKENNTLTCGQNITDPIWYDGFHNITIWANDTSGNSNYSMISFFVDTIAPEMNITYPQNISYSVNVSELNYTYTEANPGYCWYSNDFGVTNSSGVSLGTNFTDLTSAECSNNWIVYCNDSSGNENSTNITFFKDAVAPDINITFPINNSGQTNSTLYIEYTRSDTNLETCWYTNGTYKVNKTLPNCGNITGVTWALGSHNVTIWANDSLNNVNWSMLNFSIIDGTNPDINMTTPQNITYTTNITELKYTYTEANIGSCWWSMNSGNTNSSLVAMGTNFTDVNSAEGSNNLTLYCNDSSNNVNQSSVIYFQDIIIPAFDEMPTNQSYEYMLESVGYDINASDTNFDSYAVNDTTNFEINSSGFIKNVTVLNIGIYTINITINDSLNNINSTIWSVNISDTNPSRVAINTPLNQTYSTTTITFNITALDDHIVSSCSYSLDNGKNNISLTNSSTSPNNYNATNSTMQQGSLTAYFYCDDNTGNLNNTETQTFFIDSIPPDVTIISPTATTYSSASISFETMTSENSTCNYTINSGATNYSMTANSSNTGFTASQTLSNSAYTSQFYCWDLTNNLNNTENVSFTVSVSAGATGGGGTSSSGAVAPPKPKVKFMVSPALYEETIVLNRMEFGEIEIRNQANIKTEFNISVEVLEDIIVLDKTKVSISGNQKEKIEFRVYAPKDTGVYTGKIIVNVGDKIEEVFVIINVKTEKGLFDVTLLIPQFMRTMDLGETLSAQIDLLQMGLKEKIDVTLNYVIKDFAGNVHLTESETLAVYDQKSISKDFHTEDLEPGDYVLGTELIYPDGVAVASSQFKIKGEAEETDSIMMISLILVLMFVLVLIGLAIHRYKKIGKELNRKK